MSTRIAIISPHLDDAIFSLGDYIQGKDVTIITPMGGIPEDEVGRDKYIKLHAEHERACDLIGAYRINGDFLDDVYPGLDEEKLYEWLKEVSSKFDVVLVPLGIHHPDHIAVRKACDRIKQTVIFHYSELPYATDYPEEHDKLVEDMENISLKEAAVREYESQTKSDVVERVMEKERIWHENPQTNTRRKSV